MSREGVSHELTIDYELNGRDILYPAFFVDGLLSTWENLSRLLGVPELIRALSTVIELQEKECEQESSAVGSRPGL